MFGTSENAMVDQYEPNTKADPDDACDVYSVWSTSLGEIDTRTTRDEAVAFVAECRLDNVGEDGEFTDDFEIRLNGEVIEVFTAGEYHANKKEWS